MALIDRQQGPKNDAFRLPKDRRVSRRPSRKHKKRRFGANIRWLLVVIVLLLAVAAGYLLWGGQGNRSTETKKVEQSTADTPIYILGVGIDDSAVPEADGLVVLSMNQEQQYGAVISVLPEINVAVGEDEMPRLLGRSYQAGGIRTLKEQVESTLHIFIPYYVVMRMPTAAQWLDSRGKIDFYVEKDMYRDDDTGVTVNLRQGFQELDGDSAVEYLRYREDGASGLARVQRQQRLMKAFLEKLRHQQGWVNSIYTWKYWHPDETNISAQDATNIVSFLTDVPEENLHYYITPGQYVQTEDGGYWRPDPIGIQNIIGLTLRPAAPVQ